MSLAGAGAALAIQVVRPENAAEIARLAGELGHPGAASVTGEQLLTAQHVHVKRLDRQEQG